MCDRTFPGPGPRDILRPNLPPTRFPTPSPSGEPTDADPAHQPLASGAATYRSDGVRVSGVPAIRFLEIGVHRDGEG